MISEQMLRSDPGTEYVNLALRIWNYCLQEQLAGDEHIRTQRAVVEAIVRGDAPAAHAACRRRESASTSGGVSLDVQRHTWAGRDVDHVSVALVARARLFSRGGGAAGGEGLAGRGPHNPDARAGTRDRRWRSC